ncbi:ParB/RepB/Spo0J family partition protein [Paludicola sp. MB14-C6]|uniref:ParB/RepB/Spo0J family partition protein n=1 Tax=Paludihabitans sp. MB14-C6 TaxID=3070656 RepID=UPI0027DD4F4B|nr:ParB/RepB/Spo0J family partition protein [Paludicola sp. MB14-C6]WMJ22711.1 ParB/RepB/Spo0J family partition protein [Paludicola sp. MB14-C6]
MANKLNIPRHVPTPIEAFDQMLGVKNTNHENDIVNIEIDKLIPYPNQRFRLYTKEQLEEFAEDIKVNGVLSPVLVRPHKEQPDYYEILAGRNRTNASKLCGKKEVPCLILDVDDAKAKLVVTNTNLNQRRDLLPSEEAYGYKMQLEALEELGTNCPSVSKIADENNTNRKRIYRYLRLTELIDGLLDLVDDEVIPVVSGVNISFCSVEDQRVLLEFTNLNEINNISLKQSEAIRLLSEENNVSLETIDKVFFKEKIEKPKAIKLSSQKVIELIPVDVDVEDYIIAALKFFKQKGCDSNEA